MVELDRAVAVAEYQGPEAAVELVDALDLDESTSSRSRHACVPEPWRAASQTRPSPVTAR